MGTSTSNNGQKNNIRHMNFDIIIGMVRKPGCCAFVDTIFLVDYEN